MNGFVGNAVLVAHYYQLHGHQENTCFKEQVMRETRGDERGQE